MLENVPLNIRENLLFQQDGTPAHNAIVVRQYLQYLTISFEIIGWEQMDR